MVVDLLIVLICFVITGFGWLALNQDAVEFQGSSIFQLVKWVYIYGFMIVLASLPLIAVVLGYKYLASGY